MLFEIGEAVFAKAKENGALAQALAAAKRLGDRLLHEPPFQPLVHDHAPLLLRARALCRQTVTLAGLYRILENEAYAERAWYFWEDALAWSAWSDRVDMPYELATGEMAVNLAYALTWLKPWLSDEKRQRLLEKAENEIFARYLAAVPADQPHLERMWWFRAEMNWNSVCNGGACALAHIVGEASPSAPVVARESLAGLEYYMKSCHPDGSSPESCGYWVFGNLYLFYALTAYEEATGKKHPFLEGDYYRNGLDFLMDFSPQEAPLGFGDSQKARLEGWMLAAAKRCGETRQETEITHRLLGDLEAEPRIHPATESCFPTEVVTAVLGGELDAKLPEAPPLKVYPDNGWAIFSQRKMTLTFQAGTTDRFHSMRDALAINLAKNGQVLLEYIENHPYCPGWFDQPVDDPRAQARGLFWEDNSTSKSTPCVNGIGQILRGKTQWKQEKNEIISEAGHLYFYRVKALSRRVGLQGDGFVLHDYIETEMANWLEVRFTTRAEVEELEDGWKLNRNGEQIRLELSSAIPLQFYIEQRRPSIAHRPPVTILRAVLAEAKEIASIQTQIS